MTQNHSHTPLTPQLIPGDLALRQPIPRHLQIPFRLSAATFQSLGQRLQSLDLGLQPGLLRRGARLGRDEFRLGRGQMLASSGQFCPQPLQFRHRLPSLPQNTFRRQVRTVANVNAQAEAQPPHQVLQVGPRLVPVTFLFAQLALQPARLRAQLLDLVLHMFLVPIQRPHDVLRPAVEVLLAGLRRSQPLLKRADQRRLARALGSQRFAFVFLGTQRTLHVGQLRHQAVPFVGGRGQFAAQRCGQVDRVRQVIAAASWIGLWKGSKINKEIF